MSNYTITLSTTEPNNLVGLLKFRQGDKDSQVLNVTVTENGKLFKFDGLAVFFNSVLPNGTVVRDKVKTIDYTNSKLTYKVIDSFLQEVAAISAWFSFENGTKVVDSTKNFRYLVEAGWQSCITQGNYIYELSEIQREIEEIIGNKDFAPLISRISETETGVSYLKASKADKTSLSVVENVSSSNTEKIANLSSSKADKTNLSIVENVSSSNTEKIANLTSGKADKTNLSIVENVSSSNTEKIANLKNTKIDIAGTGQVSWSNISQEAREQITGGKTAVVGKNAVLNENIANNAVSRNKTNYPTKFSKVILGKLDIDLVTKVVTSSDNIAISYGSGYSYPNKAGNVALPNTTKPLYIGFENGELIASETELETYDGHLIATYYNGRLYADDYRFITVNSRRYLPQNSDGLVLYGEIKIDIVNKKFIVKKDTIITSVQYGSLRTNFQEDVSKSYIADSVAYVYYDITKNEVVVNQNLKSENCVFLGSIYNDILYKPYQDSNIFSINNVNSAEISLLTFPSYNKKIQIDTVAKTLSIEKGETPFSSIDNLYFINENAQIIDYSNLSGSVLNLYLRPLTLNADKSRYNCEYYIDYTKTQNKDIKVLTIYSGKAYSVDNKLIERVYVNGIENGGFGKKEAVILNKYDNSLSGFYNKLIAKDTRSLWIGDSTWYGYNGNENTTTFIKILETKINSFTSYKHTADNESVSGQSISYFSPLIEDFLSKKQYDVCFIGCALNGIALASVNQRLSAIENIVVKCIEKGVIPILVNQQSNQVPNTISGDNWTNRKTINSVKYDLSLRKSIAKKFGLDMLDVLEMTYDLYRTSSYKISDLLKDGLHGSSLVHEFTADYFLSKIIEDVVEVKEDTDIELYSQYYNSDISVRYVKDKINGVFKSSIQYVATSDSELLQEVNLYLYPESNFKLNLIGNCKVKVVINDVVYDSVSLKGVTGIVDKLYGKYVKVSVYSKSGNVDYEGMKLIKG